LLLVISYGVTISVPVPFVFMHIILLIIVIIAVIALELANTFRTTQFWSAFVLRWGREHRLYPPILRQRDCLHYDTTPSRLFRRSYFLLFFLTPFDFCSTHFIFFFCQWDSPITGAPSLPFKRRFVLFFSARLFGSQV
jgi:hypothetical protein